MVTRISFAVVSVCLISGFVEAAQESFSNLSNDRLAMPSSKPVEWSEIGSLHELRPQSGDLVILDVDNTLIEPVHGSMKAGEDSLRNWWKPILGLSWGDWMSRAWCYDRRRLVEEISPQTIARWRQEGVAVSALTARKRELPWGGPMEPGLARQLSLLGIPFDPPRVNQRDVLVPGSLCCTDGLPKIDMAIEAARKSHKNALGTVWIVDDLPDKGWKDVLLHADDPNICVVQFHHNERALKYSWLLEVAELGYFMKTGRWFEYRHSNSVKGLQGVYFRHTKPLQPNRIEICGYFPLKIESKRASEAV